jgi:hypothetical protein
MKSRSLQLTTIFILRVLASGCATYSKNEIVQGGPGIDFKAEDVNEYREIRKAVYTGLLDLAELPPAGPSTAGQWGQFVGEGIQFADRKCEQYMDALFWLNRQKSATVSQISLTGAAAGGALAAVTAAADEIALITIAFGLAGSTVENLANNVLYELEPSGVRNLVEALQREYSTGLEGRTYDNRTNAFADIQGYVALCLPANIEAEVNNAVKQAEPQWQEQQPTATPPPKVSISP